MCLALAHYKGFKVKDEYLQTAWHNNHDGAGLMYFRKGRLHWGKTLRKFDDLMEMYHKAARDTDTGVVVHFRRASVGDITMENVHPFIYKNVGMVHNGTIYNVAPKKGLSDTRTFGDDIVSRLSNLVFTNKAIEELIRGYVGRSKLIMMCANTGAIKIINSHLGEVNDGIWYSNYEYRMLKNRFNLDYGYCGICDIRLFGKVEQLKGLCNGCCAED